MANNSGKSFYDRQVALLEAHDIEGLVQNQYHTDAEVVGFDFCVKGQEAIRQHFQEYLQRLGSIKLKSTDKFTETDDSIFFEATIQVSAGEARVYDVFVLRDGKATHHFTGLNGFTPNVQA